jgi:hypothetical protein
MDKCRFCGGYGEPWEFTEFGENGMHTECARVEDGDMPDEYYEDED